MSVIGPEVSAADHLLPIVIGHNVAATFTPLTPGGGVSQRHPPIFIVSPALALLFNQCEWFPDPISWRFDPRIQNLSSAIESSGEARKKINKSASIKQNNAVTVVLMHNWVSLSWRLPPVHLSGVIISAVSKVQQSELPFDFSIDGVWGENESGAAEVEGARNRAKRALEVQKQMYALGSH